MRSSLLPRRAVLGAVLSVSLVGAGLAAFAADPTAGCSFTDPAGDSSIPNGNGASDDDLDLLTLGYSTNSTSLLLSAKLKKLTGSGPDLFAGDDYEFDFTVNKKVFEVGATRIGDPRGGPPLDVTAYVYVDGTEKAATSLKAVYDVKASVVEVSISSTDLSKLAGVPIDGAPLTALSVFSFAYTGGPERQADVAKPAAPVTWTYGAAACDGGTAAPAPSTGASPSASASAAPSSSASPAASSSASPAASGSASPAGSGAPAAPVADGPTPGCADITDPKGDASPNATNPGAPTPNDPDLDILAVNFQTEPETLKAYLKIDKLGTKPASGNGHRFNAKFTAGTKTVEVYGGQPDAVASGANGVLVPATGSIPSGLPVGPSAPAAGGVRIGGTYNATIKTSAVFDVKNSRVVLAIDRATLDKALGTPLADGTVVKATSAGSAVYSPTGGNIPADTAQAAKPEEQVYAIGDNKCFAAVAASGGTPTVTVSAPARVQTSDRAPVALTFTDSSGKPVAGAAVTARIGAGPISRATTDSGGRASFAVAVVDAAGRRNVLVSYAGDASGAGAFQVRRDIAVLAEVSKIAYRSSGTGSVHTFTITLTDDDSPSRHPYAGAVVTFAYSGKRVSVRTNSLGRASVQAKPGARVDVSYGGRSGFVRPATARTIVQ